MQVFTIGHSTRPIEEFLALLREHHIELLADIRTVPGSRHNPQYGQAALKKTLEEHCISYRWLEGLGGLRKAKKDSVNAAWRNASFRGYADYMQTPEFAAALEELMTLANEKHTAIMCAEAVPWRCHRSLVADALLARGAEVFNIMSEASAPPHKLTPFARVEGGAVTYPA